MKSRLRFDWVLVAILVWYVVHVVYEVAHRATWRYAFFGTEPWCEVAGVLLLISLAIADDVAGRVAGKRAPLTLWAVVLFVAAFLESFARHHGATSRYIAWAELLAAVLFSAGAIRRQFRTN